MKKLFLILSALTVTTLAYAASFPDITIADVKAAIAARKVVLLDANGTDSWQEGHVPTAIDFAANQEKLALLLPKDKDALVVAYCGNPHCAAYLQAANAAKKLGYTNVKHMAAGIAGWKESGETIEKAK